MTRCVRNNRVPVLVTRHLSLDGLSSGRPLGQCQPMDLGVVPDIDRKLRWEIETVDRGGMRMLQSDKERAVRRRRPWRRPSFLGAASTTSAGCCRPGLPRPISVQRAPRGCVRKLLLARFSKEGARLDLDPFGLASAEPESSCRIEVTGSRPCGARPRRLARKYQVARDKCQDPSLPRRGILAAAAASGRAS